MTPAHVHKAIQEYLELDTFATALGLDFSDQESLPLFDPFSGLLKLHNQSGCL